MRADQARFPPLRRSPLGLGLAALSGLAGATLLWLGFTVFSDFPAWPGQPGGWHSLWMLLAFALMLGLPLLPPADVWAFDADAEGLMVWRNREGPPQRIGWAEIDRLTCDTLWHWHHRDVTLTLHKPDGARASMRLALGMAEGTGLEPFLRMLREAAASGGFSMIGPPPGTLMFLGINWRFSPLASQEGTTDKPGRGPMTAPGPVGS